MSGTLGGLSVCQSTVALVGVALVGLAVVGVGALRHLVSTDSGCSEAKAGRRPNSLAVLRIRR